MKTYKTQPKSSNFLNYFNLLIVVIFFSAFQVNPLRAQNNTNQSNKTTDQDEDWNVATTDQGNLTKEEKELAQQTALGWEKWDAANPSEASVVMYDIEEEEQKNKIKSPNQVLMSALIGNWKGFYGGSKAYINFNKNKTVVINTSVFSNLPSASGREHTQLYYEIDASKSPYRLIFYNRDKEIKGVFRLNDNDKITLCHNFDNKEQPQEIDNKYTIINFSKVEIKEEID